MWQDDRNYACSFCGQPRSDARIAELEAENARLREDASQVFVEELRAVPGGMDMTERVLDLEAQVAMLERALDLACERLANVLGACPLDAIPPGGFPVGSLMCTECLQCMDTIAACWRAHFLAQADHSGDVNEKVKEEAANG